MDSSNIKFGSFHCKFQGCKDKNGMSSSQQYKAWPDNMSMQVCLALQWQESFSFIFPALKALNDIHVLMSHLSITSLRFSLPEKSYSFNRILKQYFLCLQSIDELLVYGNDVSLPLTHGVGSALCASTNTAYEYRRPMTGRIQLVNKIYHRAVWET